MLGGMIVELRLDSCMRLWTMSLRVTSTPVAVALGQLSLASASLQTRKIVTSTKGGLKCHNRVETAQNLIRLDEES